MKTMSKRFLLGMLAVALVFGMAVLGCSDEEGGTTSEYDGTWVKDNYFFILLGNNYTFKQGSSVIDQGTFSVSGTTFTGKSNTYSVTSTCTVSISGNTMTVSNHSDPSLSSIFNGTWTRQ